MQCRVGGLTAGPERPTRLWDSHGSLDLVVGVPGGTMFQVLGDPAFQ